MAARLSTVGSVMRFGDFSIPCRKKVYRRRRGPRSNCLSPEQHVPVKHPVRPIRRMVDQAFEIKSADCLQYTIRRERMFESQNIQREQGGEVNRSQTQVPPEQ